MKKICAVILMCVIVLNFSACGRNDNSGQMVQETTKETSPLEVLETIWGIYEEEEKFSVAGGDSASTVMDMPGAFNVTNEEELESILGFPATEAGLIDEAASLVHMMNANTFTCGVFHVKDEENVTVVTEAVRENILNRQWLCGFPDTLIVAVVEEKNVLAAFGHTENMELFKKKLLAAYETSTIIYEESLNQ